MEQNAVQEKYAILKINVHPFQISNSTKVVVSKRNFAFASLPTKSYSTYTPDDTQGTGVTPHAPFNLTTFLVKSTNPNFICN